MAEGITRYASEAAEALLDELGLDPEQMVDGGVDIDEWNGAVMVAIDAAQLHALRKLNVLVRLRDPDQTMGSSPFGEAYVAGMREALRQLGKTEKDLEAP